MKKPLSAAKKLAESHEELVRKKAMGKRIKARLKKLKLKQSDVVKAVNADKGDVRSWCNGLTTPTSANLIKLAKLLQTTPCYLVTGEHGDDDDEDIMTTQTEKTGEWPNAIINTPTPEEMKELRASMSMTQPQVAEMLGLSSRQLIGDYERGIKTPTPQTWTLWLLLAGRHPTLSLTEKVEEVEEEEIA